MLKNFTPRLYQETIFNTCAKYNTLVVLPTGLGKTNIFVMTAAFRLQQYSQSKILLLGPTRPLIKQYFDVFQEHVEIPREEMAIFTGHVPPEKREELWKKARIIFSTPQGLENDIINKRIALEDVSLLGFDEAHRAVGDYSYVWIAKQYQIRAQFPRIIALTASPGTEIDHIQEVCTNLNIEEIEVRTEHDPDVREYIQDIDIEWVSIPLPEWVIQIRNYLQSACTTKINVLKMLGYQPPQRASRKELLGFLAQLHAEIALGVKTPELLKSISLMAEIMKIQHALELIETQGIHALSKYFAQLEEDAKTTKVKATQNVVNDTHVRMAMMKTQLLLHQQVEHPKIAELKNKVAGICMQNTAAKCIVFSQYRDTITNIVAELNSLPGIQARVFVGQAHKKGAGLSQKEQLGALEDFRQGKFNVLVSSSVGEEGLDIPAVDIVFFYEPVPSAIRHIQRRGRTARNEKGKVIVLVAKDTRDEIYRWSSFHKEKRMHRLLKELKGRLKMRGQRQIVQPQKEKQPVKIYADFREKGTHIIKELIDLGIEVRLEQLPVGDYIASAKVGIEYKSVGDFAQSIIDGRLLQQLIELKRMFEKPVMIVEGFENIYTARNIHPHALQGMLATIAISFGIPLLFTKTNKETAQLISIIARREQEEDNTPPSLHTSKKPLSTKELQEYIVSAFPGIGASLAKPLLQEFKTVKNMVNATEEQLMNVHLIGTEKAKRMREVLDSEYREE